MRPRPLPFDLSSRAALARAPLSVDVSMETSELLDEAGSVRARARRSRKRRRSSPVSALTSARWAHSWLSMGNLLSRFRPLIRRRRPAAFPVRREDAPPGRAHPAAPAPARGPGHRLLPRGPAPAASGCHTAGRRPCAPPQTRRSAPGVLPLVRWKDPPRRPRLCFRDPRTVYIPPPRGRPALPGQEVQAGKPRPAGTVPPPCPQDPEVKVQEECPEGRAQNPDHPVPREGQGAQDSPYSAGDPPLTSRTPETTGVLPSGRSSPGPLALRAQRPQGGRSGSAPLSPRRCSRGGPVVASSGGPAGDAPPALQPGPSPGCLLRPQRPAEGVLRGDRPPSGPASLPLCGETEAPKPSRSDPPPASAARKPCKRPRPLPLQLPLPPLRWDRGELPPPPKLPCLAGESILGADTEAGAACGATRSAPASSPPGPARADPLPPATHTGQVAAPITAGGNEGVTSQPTSDDEDIEMDTTPPCYACTIITYPDSSGRFPPVYQIQYSVGHRAPAAPPPAHLP